MNNEYLAIGELLKQRRQALNLTIEQVSNKLKVKPQDVSKIEETLNQPVSTNLYLTGFIRAYGKLLKINHLVIEEKIQSLKIKSNTSNKNHKLVNIGEKNLIPDKKIVNNATIIFISLFLILLFAYNIDQHFNNVTKIVETYKFT